MAGIERMTSRLVAALFALLLSAHAGIAQANWVTAGTLTCTMASGWGWVLASSRPLRCTFTSSSNVGETYTGSIDKIGVDIGYTDSTTIEWLVLASAGVAGPGALSGVYVGATGSAAVGGGVGAHVLFGGGQSIALQPVSFQSGTGLDVAAGLAMMSLTFGGTQAP